MNGDNTVGMPAVKLASVWGAVAVTSWADLAAMLAAIYTLILIGEWFFKKFIRPFCERHGWMKRLHKRYNDPE